MGNQADGGRLGSTRCRRAAGSYLTTALCTTSSLLKSRSVLTTRHRSATSRTWSHGFASYWATLDKNAFVLPHLAVDVGFNIEIGDNTFINQNATFLDSYPIKIGSDVQVGPNCAFYPVGHPVRVAERRITLSRTEATRT